MFGLTTVTRQATEVNGNTHEVNYLTQDVRDNFLVMENVKADTGRPSLRSINLFGHMGHIGEAGDTVFCRRRVRSEFPGVPLYRVEYESSLTQFKELAFDVANVPSKNRGQKPRMFTLHEQGSVSAETG